MYTYSHTPPKDLLAHSYIHSSELINCSQNGELFQLCRGYNTKVVSQYMGPAILDNDPLVTLCVSKIFLA